MIVGDESLGRIGEVPDEGEQNGRALSRALSQRDVALEWLVLESDRDSCDRFACRGGAEAWDDRDPEAFGDERGGNAVARCLDPYGGREVSFCAGHLQCDAVCGVAGA
ncbi:MAG TPA: hypothetical protein VGH67_00980 [Solirubrobacteraceae bacterium]